MRSLTEATSCDYLYWQRVTAPVWLRRLPDFRGISPPVSSDTGFTIGSHGRSDGEHCHLASSRADSGLQSVLYPGGMWIRLWLCCMGRPPGRNAWGGQSASDSYPGQRCCLYGNQVHMFDRRWAIVEQWFTSGNRMTATGCKPRPGRSQRPKSVSQREGLTFPNPRLSPGAVS